MLRLSAVGALAAGVLTVTSSLPGAAAAPAAPSPARPLTTPAAAPSGTGEPGPRTGLTRTKTPRLTTGVNAKVKQSQPVAAARTFLAGNTSRYRIDTSSSALVHDESTKSKGVNVERFEQHYKGVPVFGAQYVVRLKDEGSTATVLGTSGDYFTDLAVDTRPRISAEFAKEVAKHSFRPQQWEGVTSVKDHGMVIIPTGPGILTRHLTVHGYDAEARLPLKQEVYVGRGRTTPVLTYSNIQTDGPTTTTGEAFHSPTLPLNVFQRGATYELRDQSRAMFATSGGEIRTYDAEGRDYYPLGVGGVPPGMPLVTSSTAPFPKSTNTYGGLDAHWGAGKVYEYFRGLGRDGLDGKGGSIASVVNVTANGKPYANAFWNGEIMVYGTGEGGLRPFAAALDVVGHEMTHGVVSHTSNLIYIGQSGAANEAFSDYFGNAIENKEITPPAGLSDGLLGESSCDESIPPTKCALRDMNALMTTFEFFNGTEDNGGVHINSPILSGALWQIRRELGGAFADGVAYDVMTEYLTPLSQFMDVRTAMVAAAKAKGATPAQVSTIDRAFIRHGIVPNWESTLHGADSTLLVRPVQAMFGPESRGDRYVLSNYDLQSGKSLVQTGRLSRPGASVISPPDGDDFYDAPTTDGSSAAWATITWGENGEDRTLIQRRSLSGGPITTVADLGKDPVWGMAMDGKVVAWQVLVNGTFRIRAKLPNGRIVEMPGTSDTRQIAPEVNGNWIVYADLPAEPSEFSTARLMRYDIRKGRTVALATVTAEAESSAYLWSPTVVGKDVLFMPDAQYQLQVGVSSVPLKGGRVKVLVPEDDPMAPTAVTFGANKDLLAWERTTSFAEPSRILVRNRHGGPIKRMSCGQGSQFNPLVGDRSTVAWLDSTTSTLSLVMRNSPRGNCPDQ